MIRVADYIIQVLQKYGVNHFFMITGRGNLFLTDAVAANKKIKAISVHHEQSAAFAAVACTIQSKNRRLPSFNRVCKHKYYY